MTKHFALTFTLFLATSVWAAQTGSTSSAPAQQPAAAAPAQPQGPRPPQAKTQAELDDYRAAGQNADPAAAEAAVDAFAVKYPDSELTGFLYAALQRKFQGADNSDKTIESGRKALKYLPDHPLVLVLTANTIAERTRETDLDRDERYAESAKYAQHSLEVMDTGLTAIAGNMSPEQMEQLKNGLRSMAYNTLGWVSMNKKDYPVAEEHFRKAADADPNQPDPYVYYRLALVLDYQKKYAEALKAANRCVELAQTDATLLPKAKQEQSRLTKLVGAPAAPATPPSQPTPQTPPPSGK